MADPELSALIDELVAATRPLIHSDPPPDERDAAMARFNAAREALHEYDLRERERQWRAQR